MNCSVIDENFKTKCQIPSDIYQHLETIKNYAEKCETVVEFGVRGIVSTWAMLAGKPKKMISYDIQHPSIFGENIEKVYQAANDCEINYQFILGDTTKISIEECDMLFIDTLHTYNQMKKELELHANKVKKYLIFHDTTTFRDIGENGEVGIYSAIQEFLENNSNWTIEKEFKNNNGLLILKKI